MTKPKLYKFQDQHFNEFIVQWFSNLSMEELRMLSAEENYKIHPERIKKWVLDASTDEKLLMLSKTGGEFFLVAGKNNGWKAINSEKSIFQQYYKQSDRQVIIDALVKEKVFVLASQQMMLASFYMHQNCQTDYWRLNADFLKTYTLWDLTKQKIGKYQSGDNLERVQAATNLIVDFAFHIHRNQSFFANLGLGAPVDLLVLLFLMQKNNKTDNRNKFTDGAQIYNACNDGTYTPNGMGRRMFWLAQHGFTKKMPTEKRPRYAIADRGVQVVMMYVQKMAELVKFDL